MARLNACPSLKKDGVPEFLVPRGTYNK
jgi:hypothetical protein